MPTFLVVIGSSGKKLERVRSKYPNFFDSFCFYYCMCSRTSYLQSFQLNKYQNMSDMSLSPEKAHPSYVYTQFMFCWSAMRLVNSVSTENILIMTSQLTKLSEACELFAHNHFSLATYGTKKLHVTLCCQNHLDKKFWKIWKYQWQNPKFPNYSYP